MGQKSVALHFELLWSMFSDIDRMANRESQSAKVFLV